MISYFAVECTCACECVEMSFTIEICRCISRYQYVCTRLCITNFCQYFCLFMSVRGCGITAEVMEDF